MREFGMFTDAGETVVASLVDLAKKSNLSWDTVESMLQSLSNEELYSEASDTEVRECVYCELYGA